MRSMREDRERENFGGEMVTSSSLSEDVAEDDEGGDASSGSLDGGRGVALTVWEAVEVRPPESQGC